MAEKGLEKFKRDQGELKGALKGKRKGEGRA